MSSRRHCSSRSFAVVAALLVLACCSASIGDRDTAFRWCVDGCAKDGRGCVALPPPLHTEAAAACSAACPLQTQHAVPPSLKLLRWSCQDDCRYRCMQKREAVRLQERAADPARPRTVKYFGKWPFARILGMQEIASVLFSLANLVAHAHSLARFHVLLHTMASQHRRDSGATTHSSRTSSTSSNKRSSSSGGGGSSIRHNFRQWQHRMRVIMVAYPYAPLWVGYAALNLAAWTASAAFHARDVRATEVADYLIADVLILYGLLLTIARAAEWQSPKQWALLGAAGAAAFLYHAHHMLYVLFDYGLNVAICVAAGAVQTLTWAMWVTRRRHPGRKRMYTFLLLVNLATALEVFDFPPLWGILDAHALWHAATVPLAYQFWSFVATDAQWCFDRTAAAASARHC